MQTVPLKELGRRGWKEEPSPPRCYREAESLCGIGFHNHARNSWQWQNTHCWVKRVHPAEAFTSTVVFGNGHRRIDGESLAMCFRHFSFCPDNETGPPPGKQNRLALDPSGCGSPSSSCKPPRSCASPRWKRCSLRQDRQTSGRTFSVSVWIRSLDFMCTVLIIAYSLMGLFISACHEFMPGFPNYATRSLSKRPLLLFLYMPVIRGLKAKPGTRYQTRWTFKDLTSPSFYSQLSRAENLKDLITHDPRTSAQSTTWSPAFVLRIPIQRHLTPLLSLKTIFPMSVRRGGQPGLMITRFSKHPFLSSHTD